ncbi:MAG: nitrilase-related carbon-nitrogen hydrolase [Bacteroidota bacterium]
MQNLTISLVQADQKWEDKTANFLNYERLLDANELGDVVLLPEMFHTGFSMNTELLGETMEESQGLQWLKENAKRRNIAIYTSLIIKDGEHYFNRGVFVEPDGKTTTYDKRKTFGLAGEDNFYSSGKEKSVVNFKGWNIFLQICYDLRFPEICRNQLDENGVANYDLLLYVANWPETRSLHWNTLLQARAIENQCYVAGVNRVGSAPNNLSYSGNSQVVDLLGNVQAMEPHKEGLVSFELNGSILTETRQKLPFLKDAQF